MKNLFLFFAAPAFCAGCVSTAGKTKETYKLFSMKKAGESVTQDTRRPAGLKMKEKPNNELCDPIVKAANTAMTANDRLGKLVERRNRIFIASLFWRIHTGRGPGYYDIPSASDIPEIARTLEAEGPERLSREDRLYIASPLTTQLHNLNNAAARRQVAYSYAQHLLLDYQSCFFDLPLQKFHYENPDFF